MMKRDVLLKGGPFDGRTYEGAEGNLLTFTQVHPRYFYSSGISLEMLVTVTYQRSQRRGVYKFVKESPAKSFNSKHFWGKARL